MNPRPHAFSSAKRARYPCAKRPLDIRPDIESRARCTSWSAPTTHYAYLPTQIAFATDLPSLCAVDLHLSRATPTSPTNQDSNIATAHVRNLRGEPGRRAPRVRRLKFESRRTSLSLLLTFVSFLERTSSPSLDAMSLPQPVPPSWKVSALCFSCVGGKQRNGARGGKRADE